MSNSSQGSCKSRSAGRIGIAIDFPNETPTTTTPPGERPRPVLYPHRQSLSQHWSNPFVPSKASEWPDEKSKKNWIGPFDMDYDIYARSAREADWKEGESICNVRKLAESLFDMGDFAGACYAWTQIADRYILEHQQISLWTSDINYRTARDKQYALGHIAKASIGCILNAHLAQYPDLCAASKVDNENRSCSHAQLCPVFTAVVNHEDDLITPRALYIKRVMLDYASDIYYEKDHSWMRTVYQRALDASGQIVGMDLSETIRLRQGLVHGIVESERKAYWERIDVKRHEYSYSLSKEQQEAHRIQSTRTWKDEVEELYLHNIADQQSLWGTTAEATIGSELKLVDHYKSVGDNEKAKARARRIYTLTIDHLGEDHDSTFRCIASLSTLLMDLGSIEEAGLVVHGCLTKHPGMMSGSTDMLWYEVLEKFVIGRGWKEVMLIRGKLERLMSPLHFIWADYRLYTLRIGTITFAPIYLTDMEKDSAWALAYQEPKDEEENKESYSDDGSSTITREHLRQQSHAIPRSETNVEKLAFGGSERHHEFLDLQVPYIPYEHFKTTSAFAAGMPYLEYVKATEDRSISSHIHGGAATDTPIRISEYLRLQESRDRKSDGGDADVERVEKQENKESAQPPIRAGRKEFAELEFDEVPTTTLIQGFFNTIPSEAYVSPELHVDLVSTQWADYQHFALHQLPDSATEIEIAEGLFLPCYGYISGTWTDFDVYRQRKVHEVFVADVSFLPAGVNGQMPMFAIRQETLQSSRYHEVTNVEKRAFCARLNPSFFRYKPLRLYELCSVYKREMAKRAVFTNTDELALWDEMNAREKWDRDFETRNPTNDADRAILARDLEAEDERRKLWDENKKKEGKGKKESWSDSSITESVSVQEDNSEIQSVPINLKSKAESDRMNEAAGGKVVQKIRLLLRRTKVEARTTQVASDIC